jgi:hypothetical protein
MPGTGVDERAERVLADKGLEIKHLTRQLWLTI